MGSRFCTLRITALTLPISSLIGIGVQSPSRFTYTPAKAANTNASARETKVRKPHKSVYTIPVPSLRPEPRRLLETLPHTVGTWGGEIAVKAHSARSGGRR